MAAPFKMDWCVCGGVEDRYTDKVLINYQRISSVGRLKCLNGHCCILARPIDTNGAAASSIRNSRWLTPKSPRPLRSSIVASAHLAEQSQELSELEYGIIVASAALMRWMERCMQACGTVEMNALDVMVLHNLASRGRAKRQADICLLLNVEDTHTVTYALKKLSKLGLVEGAKQGKEMFYRTTEKGAARSARNTPTSAANA